MDWWLLTFFLGAILSLFLPEVPAVFQLFLLLCLAISFYYHKKLRYSAGLCFGAFWILTQAHLYHQLPEQLIEQMHNKQAIVVEGQVLSLQVKGNALLDKKQPRNAAEKTPKTTKRFNFIVNKLNKQQLSLPIVIRLSWKKASFELSQGQRLTLNVKLKPAHGLANLGGFNYLSWLKAHNISATGYVINPRKSKNKNNKSTIKSVEFALQDQKIISKNKLLRSEASIRQKLFEQYQYLTPNNKLTPVLLALVFGDRSLLKPEHWQVLQATGTGHLIAISGLHVGLLAASAYFITMLFFQYLPLSNPHWQCLNSRYIAIIVSVLLATLYAYLAGFSLPTQRALVMLNLYWFSRIVGIKLSAKRLMLVTIFILLIFSPFSLLTASFWLSFYAVAIIFVTLWRFNAWLNKGSSLWRFFKSLFIIQITLTVMLMPISAIFFQQLSLVSLVANIVAVPWMSLFSIPIALISMLFMPLNEQLSQWFMMLSLQSLTWLWFYLELLSERTYAIVSLSLIQQNLIVIFGALAFYILYLAPGFGSNNTKKIVFTLLASVIALGFTYNIPLSQYFLAPSKSLGKNEELKQLFDFDKKHTFSPWQAIFFDVGQGLSVLVKRNNHAMLYDTGAAYPSGFTMSEAVILPYLQYLGINELDKVILSHSDNDHAGGIQKLANNLVIAEVISNDDSIVNIIDKNTLLTACNTNYSFSWQGLTFETLWPLAPIDLEVLANKGKQKNDDSCVILITDSKGKRLLLTGDISAKVEQQLLIRYPELVIDVLQVPHHGSKTSSSQAFLRQLSPKIALVSAGFLNRWYMPVTTVRQRYAKANITLLNSAELGQVIITFDEGGISKKNYVEDLRPFWFSH
ncbi:DNA internalization-related competence protein ComEC/Rec2 [Colwellia psychrerythraea]|uniref:DNA internalization-related competence protein ComEC/Rec2 n=1 Tax=Colwellia psychrerythraea TaxID=28229 RepID=A0A099KJV9_COLPS|nr:DNA internalization-related competence protein ComEC/Rec2 [Colwellia psychrerythraea]KGJ89888.1 DNA internalization-related competence protein ComEC/Rec2 [Colwellia psychrerythraea]